jgi:hypothetical protein
MEPTQHREALGDHRSGRVIGMMMAVAGTIPRKRIFAANWRYYASVPWAVPLTSVYLWFFWRYLKGAGRPESTAEERRTGLRAKGRVGLRPSRRRAWHQGGNI